MLVFARCLDGTRGGICGAGTASGGGVSESRVYAARLPSSDSTRFLAAASDGGPEQAIDPATKRARVKQMGRRCMRV